MLKESTSLVKGDGRGERNRPVPVQKALLQNCLQNRATSIITYKQSKHTNWLLLQVASTGALDETKAKS